MWPYAKRGTRFYGDVDERFPSKLVDEFFDINDTAIKLWLPERLLAGLDVLSCESGVSRPDVLRALLFMHVYGRVEFMHLLRRISSNDVQEEPRFSIARLRRRATARAIRVQYLGKSKDDLKLELPRPLKQSLESLAQRSNEGLSPYIRRILARELLPESEYLDWQDAEAAATEETD